ncbi:MULTISPECIES: energy-coupling factor ABC transporter ATP-binding protein [Bacillus]|uniref:Cobalt/nickel transport system ATP-binding protein n=1 Tax=Bacillus amyloliquefaciens (strain Y2) TaxID=1155777 RepID=I2C0R2_BACAY|nr:MULTISPECIES: energy-coupling factor ABC transporter ATP-binding protein [Bacillus]AFJ60236.1 cobalt/nickel transport system ATP-binding protein [Bacillus velezensis YAU B9601-Y2]AJE77244.1 cobalt transporter ATP-binding subunit [Bacillus sp. BH072]AUG34385.1 energy-coupling factor ABC transporter ATP-binding protein [Bacillus velezensis]KFI14147.1 cobalt transporter ATP-binding subunit [Bacillus velezensis]MCK6102598.1 energy-coupling factor ABC transporter ATP-binding protein [Bacillus ve
MDQKQLISVKDILFRYRKDAERPALDGVSLEVYEGEWLAIVGHNGSGKSTLARALNGLILSEAGEIEVGGIKLTEDTVWDVRKKIGMVFQNPDNQFVGTTVRDDVAFGLENNGVPREEMIERVDWAVTQVNMQDFLDQEPHHLSGGQKQRVAIAGIIAARPDIMILDEATSMLDPIGREEVLDTVRRLKDQGMATVISITHDLEEAARADRIIVMNGGRKYAEGTPEEIFKLNEDLVRIGLDLPFSFQLSLLLKESGLALTKNHLTQEGLVNELWTLKSKM